MEILANITRIIDRYRNPILSQLPDYIRQELQSHAMEVLSRTPLRLVVEKK